MEQEVVWGGVRVRWNVSGEEWGIAIVYRPGAHALITHRGKCFGPAGFCPGWSPAPWRSLWVWRVLVMARLYTLWHSFSLPDLLNDHLL